MNKINDIYLPKNNSEEYWFKNPSILFINLDQIYPFGKLTHIYRFNLIARLALYIVFMIILLNLNKILLFLPLILFLFSYYLSLNNINQTTTASEVLYDVSGDNTISNNSNEIPVDVLLNNNISKNLCSKPTLNNPFMNYTLGDAFNKQTIIDVKSQNTENLVERLPACNYDDVKNDIRKQFRSILYTDLTDIWGKYISDRNFYTMPNTSIVNNQVQFANWCYNMENSGLCKTLGKNCLKYRDPHYQRR